MILVILAVSVALWFGFKMLHSYVVYDDAMCAFKRCVDMK